MNGNGQASPATPALHIAQSDYVDLVARSYLRAVREVNVVRDEAHEEARRQNADVLATRFQLSPLHLEQIRIIGSTFLNVLQFAPAFDITERQIRQIIRRLDEYLSTNRGETGGVDPAWGSQSAVAVNQTSQSRRRNADERDRPDNAEWSRHGDDLMEVVLVQASTTTLNPEPAVSEHKNPVDLANGTNQAIVDSFLSSSQNLATSNDSTSSLQGLPRLSTSVATKSTRVSKVQNDEEQYLGNGIFPAIRSSVLSKATIAIEDHTENNRQPLSSRNTNQRSSQALVRKELDSSNGDGRVAPPQIAMQPLATNRQPDESKQKPRFSMKGPVSPGLDRYSLTRPQKPTLSVLLQDTTPPPLSPSLRAVDTPLRSTLLNSLLPVVTATTTSHSPAISCIVPCVSAAVPASSSPTLQVDASPHIAIQHNRQQASAKSGSMISLTFGSPSASESASRPISTTYRHSRLGTNHIRKVTVGLNGQVISRASGSSQPAHEMARKRLSKLNASGFASSTHTEAVNAAHARIQQAMLEGPEAPLNSATDSAITLLPDVPNQNMLALEKRSRQPSRIMYSSIGPRRANEEPRSISKDDNNSSAPAIQLPRTNGSVNAQAKSSQHSPRIEDDRIPIDVRDDIPPGPSARDPTQWVMVIEAATPSELQDGFALQSDTWSSTVNSSINPSPPAPRSGEITSAQPKHTETAKSVEKVHETVTASTRTSQVAHSKNPEIGSKQPPTSSISAPANTAVKQTTRATTVPDTCQLPVPRGSKMCDYPLPLSSGYNASTSVPPLPQWLKAQFQERRRGSRVPPLPKWAQLPEHTVPAAPYANKRQRIYAPEPEWCKAVTVRTKSNQLALEGVMERDSDRTSTVVAGSGLQAIATALPAASTETTITDTLPSDGPHIPTINGVCENQTPRLRPGIVIDSTADNNVKRTKRTEEIVSTDPDNPLDVSPAQASASDEPTTSLSAPVLAPISRPVFSDSDHGNSKVDDDIVMSDTTPEERLAITPACLPSTAHQPGTRLEEDDMGTFSSSSPRRTTDSPDPISAEPQAADAPSVTASASATVTIMDKEAPIVPRSPEPAPGGAHVIPTEITPKDIIQWQRKVWRACFCEWAGCGAILNDWESLEKHIVLAHVTHQRPRPIPGSHKPSAGSPSPAVSFPSDQTQVDNGRRLLVKPNTAASRFNDQRSRMDEDEDPIALHPGTNRARSHPRRLILNPPGSRNNGVENREPQEYQQLQKIWLPFICRYGDCVFMQTANVAFASTLSLRRHIAAQHLDVNCNKSFPCCVVKDCPYNFSEAFNTIPLSHKHIRSHPPPVLADMQYAQDMRATAPTSTLIPLPDKEVPTCLIICPPVRNGPKAPVQAMIQALAETQDLWDSQADMTFRTAFGFVPVSHTESAMDGAPMPPYNMYAQGTPSDTRSVFNPVPEYTLCTPRHPASHRSWKRLPVKMELVPKSDHEKLVTPWCNLSELSRRDDAKTLLIMTRDPEQAIREQEKKGPRKVALEDPAEIGEGMYREWPLRGTIGPGYYLDAIP